MNADRFSLAKIDQLGALVGPVPQRFSRWTQTFAVLHVLLGLARRGTKRSDLQNAVDAVRVLDERTQLFVSAGIYPPRLPPGPSAWPAFLEWAVEHARSIART